MGRAPGVRHPGKPERRLCAPTHPDRAIGIWKKVAESQIARVQASGYEAAVPYLRKVKTAFTRSGRKQEWEGYLASLRERNRRRPRCLEILGRLESGRRRIIDG